MHHEPELKADIGRLIMGVIVMVDFLAVIPFLFMFMIGFVP